MKYINSLIAIAAFFTAGCIEGDYALYNMHQPEVEVIEIEVPVQVPVEVLVPIEVPVEVPGEGGEVWIDSFEQPHTMNGIDIIWLIDQSGSMWQHSNSVIAGIEDMMLALPPTGWRLGITTTSRYTTSIVSTFPLLPGDTIADAQNAYNLIAQTSPHEAGFDALYSYMIDNSYNQSWLRDDAGLLVVFVSDENEQSSVNFNSLLSGATDFINWYGNLRPSAFIASIVNRPNTESSCPWGVPGHYVGSRYIEATNHFGGVVVDICDEDWSPGVAEAAHQVSPHEEWELTFTPIEDTLIVFVDFVEFADWAYNALNNTVEFASTPPEGSLVEIGYVIDSAAGDDDDSAGS